MDEPHESLMVPGRDGYSYRGYRIRLRLVREGRNRYLPRKVSNGADVYQFLRDLEHFDREVFYSIFLDGKNVVSGVEEVSRGTLTSSLVHPREVYKGAILTSAAALIVAHNHPSGDPTPSFEDRELTGRLYRAGDLLGIRLLDHVIVGSEGRYLSMLEKAMLGG